MKFEVDNGCEYIRPEEDELLFVKPFMRHSTDGLLPVKLIGIIKGACQVNLDRSLGAIESLRETGQLGKASECVFTLRKHVGVLSGALQDIVEFEEVYGPRNFVSVTEVPALVPDDAS